MNKSNENEKRMNIYDSSSYILDLQSFTYFFFFSSRRRHTRCSRDWSSDVCSSDLAHPRKQMPERQRILLPRIGQQHLEQRLALLGRDLRKIKLDRKSVV